MNINELVTTAHGAARAKGWWDGVIRTEKEAAMLVVTEIAEAKAGEYHDYKNNKYACGKVASSGYLRQMGFIDLAKRIENGEFDEEADEQDKAMLKRDALAGGFNEEQCKKLFGL